MSGEDHEPVVVAVGNDTHGQALDWAAAEASARRCRLHIVHAELLRWAVDPSGLVPVADFSAHRTDAEHVLRSAVIRARSVAPDIEVSAESLVGSTVSLVTSQGRGAQLLVLGGRTRRSAPWLRGLLDPSLCVRVAGRAPCPVAVVGPLRSSAHSGSSPRVVLGVDGSGACADAVGVAFRAAAQRGVPITAVHAWSPDVPADHERVRGDAAASEERAGRVLDRALEAWRSRFPDVPVDRRLLAADPAAALTRESEGAALTVVGSRARGRLRATLFGSVSRSVVQRAACPVVVVRAGEATSGQKEMQVGRGVRLNGETAATGPTRQRRRPWQ